MANDGVFIHESVIPTGTILKKAEDEVICVKVDKEPVIPKQSTF